MKPVKNTDSFGQRLKARRLAEGLSQAELASTKEMNTSNIMIGRYERDEVKPTIEVLTSMAKALNTTVSYLVGESKFPPNSDWEKIVQDILALPEKQQSDMRQTVVSLVRMKRLELIDLP